MFFPSVFEKIRVHIDPSQSMRISNSIRCMTSLYSETSGCGALDFSILGVQSPKSDQHQIFFLVISMLWKSEWSWELRAWSHKISLFDILSTSPHYFCRKWIGATNESSNFDLRPGLIEPPYNKVLGIANDIPYPSFSRIYMEKNLDSTKPRYCSQILSAPWLFRCIAVPLYR